MRKKMACLAGIAVALSLCGCEEYGMTGGGPEQTGSFGAETETVQVEVQSGLVRFDGESTGGEVIPVDASDLEGRWVDPESGTVLNIDETGELTVQVTEDQQATIETLDWRFSGDGIRLSEPVGGTQALQIVEEDGGLTLRSGETEFIPMGEEESFASDIVEELTLGQTAKTALVEFTLTGIEFAERVSLEVGSYFLPDSGGTLTPPVGKLFACVSFRVKNVSDGAVAGAQLCSLALDYDNSETFIGERFGDHNGVLKLLNSREQASLTGLIECPALVGEDNEVPLSIDVTLPDTEGEVTFRFVLK